MEKNFCRIHIRKEALKFSSAHMTVYPDGTKEALHGHNYRTEILIDLKDISLSKMICFSKFKKPLKEICDSWDEKVLIQKDCPFLKLQPSSDSEIAFTLCDKRYVLPKDEVEMLPLDNITTETLAKEFCRLFVEKLDSGIKHGAIAGVQVKVEEITGQGATFFWYP